MTMQRNIVMAGYYTFYYAAVGIYLPFLPLFLTYSHMNSLEIGFLMSIGPLAGIFAQAIWGVLADRHQRSKEYLMLALFLTAIICFLFTQAKGFSTFAWLLFLYATTNSPIIPLSDALVISTLTDRRNYGKIRRWGSFGFALTAALGGLIFSHFALSWFGVIESFILLICIAWAKFLPNPHEHIPRLPGKPSTLTNVVKTPGLLVFLIITLLYLVPYNAYTAFFGLHMQTLGANRFWIGLGWTIAALSEMLVFTKGSTCLKWLSPHKLIVLAGIVFVIRWMFYSFVQDYHLIVIMQISQCVSFALFYLAGVEYLNLLMPVYFQGSAQSAFNAVSFGISAIVGTSGAGWLIRIADIYLFYKVSALLTVGGIILAHYGLKKGQEF
jgi:MFS transporter, PPP family, 3-phenylpropionic acid transporter